MGFDLGDVFKEVTHGVEKVGSSVLSADVWKDMGKALPIVGTAALGLPGLAITGLESAAPAVAGLVGSEAPNLLASAGNGIASGAESLLGGGKGGGILGQVEGMLGGGGQGGLLSGVESMLGLGGKLNTAESMLSGGDMLSGAEGLFGKQSGLLGAIEGMLGGQKDSGFLGNAEKFVAGDFGGDAGNQVENLLFRTQADQVTDIMQTPEEVVNKANEVGMEGPKPSIFLGDDANAPTDVDGFMNVFKKFASKSKSENASANTSNVESVGNMLDPFGSGD